MCTDYPSNKRTIRINWAAVNSRWALQGNAKHKNGFFWMSITKGGDVSWKTTQKRFAVAFLP